MELDPIIVCAARLAVVLLFASACWTKMRSFGVFRATLADYELVPASLIKSTAISIVIAEALIAVFSLHPTSARGAMLAATLLLLVYGLAITINLLRGRRDIDCGCTGPAVKQLLSGWLLLRNGALIALAFVGAQAMIERQLMWIDYVMVATIVMAGVAIYAAANQLLANAPRLDALDSLMEVNS